MYEEERKQLNKLCGEAFNIHTELGELQEKLTTLRRKAKVLWHNLDNALDKEVNDNSRDIS